tara:strand:+ start:10178 stop:10279 length:102 start_codon:yes stop_codon:yes gene_type:complete
MDRSALLTCGESKSAIVEFYNFRDKQIQGNIEE